MGTSPETETADAAIENAPTYKVIFANGMGGEPTIFTGKLTGPVTVQQALEESGAIDKYKGMQVDLAREVPDKATVLKLPILFDPDTRSVLEEQNYAIHPGDEILVRKDNPGALDAVFRTLGAE
jgi:hypothetical protein